eukprot:s1749_g10.t1
MVTCRKLTAEAQEHNCKFTKLTVLRPEKIMVWWPDEMHRDVAAWSDGRLTAAASRPSVGQSRCRTMAELTMKFADKIEIDREYQGQSTAYLTMSQTHLLRQLLQCSALEA